MSELVQEQQEQPEQPEQQGLSIAQDEVQGYIDQLTAELNESHAIRRVQVVKMRGLLEAINKQNAALEAAAAEIASLKAGKRKK